RFETLKRPESSVVAVSSRLVPRFLTVTAAPETTSLFGFVTTPPIEPVVVDCANATALSASTIRLTKQTLTIFDIQGNSLNNWLVQFQVEKCLRLDQLSKTRLLPCLACLSKSKPVPDEF